MDIFAPLQFVADTVSFGWVGLQPGSYFGESLNFFIYDVLKIGLLLVVINYVMAITRYYFPMEKVRDILTKRRWFGIEFLLAALLGVITPFCSCSSIPLFLGFLSAGIPLGVTFAFLISSPLVNEASLYLFPAVFGMEATLLYNLMGVGIAIGGGMLVQKLNMERFVRPEFLQFKSSASVSAANTRQRMPLSELLRLWTTDALIITKRVIWYVVLGVGIGALIHGFVPERVVAEYLSAQSWWTVPAAVLLGAPLYANSVGVIPIIEVLVGKGVPMGSALAFMTATVTLSIPEGLLLSKILQKQLLFAFFGITIIGIIGMGYVFNWVL